MNFQDVYRELIGNEPRDRSDLPEWIAMVEDLLNERCAKVERLRREIAMLVQRGDRTDTQQFSLQVVQEEIEVLQQRLAELHQRMERPEPAQPATAPDLVIGGIAQVAQNARLSLELRTRPGTTDSGVIDRHLSGTQVTLLDGPEYADGHTWWRVRRIDGREGWIASDGLEGRPA